MLALLGAHHILHVSRIRVKGGRCVGLRTLPPSCADCLEIWEPQIPEPSWLVQACTGTACLNFGPFFFVSRGCIWDRAVTESASYKARINLREYNLVGLSVNIEKNVVDLKVIRMVGLILIIKANKMQYFSTLFR